ncbi:LamG-like jellyroll fold domain-containing protein [Reichenbachiella versicolor]|uniref:LamG-like jellyroll fold domain-containing protein n=1 Tax=Reichenbachiella versicolor TaxID=1821036 RepID=UPI000D6E2FE9|nr:LamG-like jellyroll fold domain-containing protein [Reichenbachiella versicolor]
MKKLILILTILVGVNFFTVGQAYYYYAFDGNTDDDNTDNLAGSLALTGAYTTDRYGNANSALKMTTGQALTINNGTAVLLDDYTISLWVKYDQVQNTGYIYQSNYNAQEEELSMIPDNNSMYLFYSDPGDTDQSPFTIPLGEWVMISAVRKTETIESVEVTSIYFYINGRLEDINKADKLTSELSIMLNGIIGTVDDLQIHDRAFSHFEISEEFNNGQPNPAITGLPKFGQTSSYRLVGFPTGTTPLSTAIPDISDIPTTDWVVAKYDGDKTRYLTPTDNIEAGRGYWMNNTSRTTFEIGSFAPAPPFVGDFGEMTITLHKGWNIIGNMFPVNLDWNAVIDYDINQIGNTALHALVTAGGAFTPATLYMYNGTFLDEGDHENQLPAYRGAFLFCNEDNIKITIPIDIHDYADHIASRARTVESNTGWTVDLDITNGQYASHVSQFGMHEGEVVNAPLLPRPGGEYADIQFDNGRSSEVLSAETESFLWEFNANVGTSWGETVLSWGQSDIDPSKELWLIDQESGAKIDMRFTQEYRYDQTKSAHAFAIAYGTSSEIEELVSGSSSVYPNPSTGQVFIQGEGELNVNISSWSGQQLYHSTEQSIGGRFRLDLDAAGLSKGIYLLDYTVSNAFGTTSHQEKIILTH